MSENNAQVQTESPSDPLRVFFGRVLPERTAVGLAGIPALLLTAPGHDDFTFKMHVDASCIVVETRGGSSIDDSTLKETVRGFVSSLVDCLGFTKGCGYEVEMTAVGGETIASVFGVRMGEGEDDPSATAALATELINLMLGDRDGQLIPLRRALADYRRAILEPSDTPFHAFRAVESLTYYFDRNPRRGMPRLLADLNVSPIWIREKLEIPAGEIRHGKARNIDELERREAIGCARVIIKRFADLVRRGGQPLIASEFPLLSQ